MNIFIPLYILGFAVIIHFTFVNINIGLGTYSYVLRWKSLRNPEYDKPARKAFKFLVASEIVSGVWGTIITVVLAGFWPTLMNIATTVLFIPLAISLLGISIRLPSIAGFWYTWDKTSRSIHMIIGLLMVIGGFMIPAGFRYIFALIDYPIGISNLSPLQGKPLTALFNPIYPPLIVHTWLGALSIGLFTAATGLAWSSKYDEKMMKFAGLAGLFGSLLIIPQGLSGFWFWGTLSYKSQYLFNSISTSFLSVNKTWVNASGTFLTMVLLALYLLIGGVVFYYKPENRLLGYTLSPLSILSLIMGEFTHDFGRVPYMVIIGEKGIEASLFVNKLMILGIESILIGVFSLTIILLIFVIFLYIYLVKGFLAE